jgi:hypothetical protein
MSFSSHWRLYSLYMIELFVLFPRREVLVLGDAGVGLGVVAVVDDRVALVVAGGAEGFEVQRAVRQAAFGVLEPGVDRAAVEDVVVVDFRSGSKRVFRCTVTPGTSMMFSTSAV